MDKPTNPNPELKPTAFFLEMEARLFENRKKTGWDNLPNQFLVNNIKKHLGRLERSLNIVKPSMREVIKNCADLANFAMMVSDNISKETD